MKQRFAAVSEESLGLQIAELNAEIHECISHIGCNDLHAFEESLWRQELLTSTLVTSLRARCNLPETAAVGQLLRSLANGLLGANRSYAELLQHVQQENSRLRTLTCEYGSDVQTSKLLTMQHSMEV